MFSYLKDEFIETLVNYAGIDKDTAEKLWEKNKDEYIEDLEERKDFLISCIVVKELGC